MRIKTCAACSKSLLDCNKIPGFTLIEVLLSLAILATVMCFSIPFASNLHQNNQIQARQDEIQAAIRYARTQSQLIGKNLILTPISNSNYWSNGMRIFVDNPQHRYTPDVQILHEWHWSSPNLQIIWHGFQSNNYLLFAADSSRNATNGYFLIQSQSQVILKLVVNRLGRVRTV